MSYHKGNAARKAGLDFEKEIERTFEPYLLAGIAWLNFMPVPMTPSGYRDKHGSPLYRPKGDAPFDIYGYRPICVLNPLGPAPTMKLALAIGAECKRCREPETALRIVPDDQHASGVAEHQLFNLALLASMNGVARIIWDNGGQVGVLTEQSVIAANAIFQQSRESEQRGKGKGARGSRSIRWELFTPVQTENIAGAIIPHWLDNLPNFTGNDGAFERGLPGGAN